MSSAISAAGSVAADVLTEALNCVRALVSVVPIRMDRSKAPSISWKALQSRIPTEEEVDGLFRHDVGVALVCGSVSGGLEALDFESAEAYEDWLNLVRNAGLDDTVNTMPLSRAGRGGYHLLYRCDEASVGTVLAKDADGKVLIEFRGDGQLIIEPPSPAKCGQGTLPYVRLRGDVGNIPVLSRSTRAALHDAARALSLQPEQARIVRGPARSSRDADHRRPGDHYNDEADIVPVLEEHGYRVNHSRGDITYLTRPGKASGISATYNVALRLFYMFSSADETFDGNSWYQPFAVYAHLAHGGDFTAAASALAKDGWGDPLPMAEAAVEDGSIDTHAQACSILPDTDDGNAERLVERLGAKIRYVGRWRKWIVYTGSRWQVDDTGEVMRGARETVRLIPNEITHITTGKKDTDRRYHWACASQSERGLNAMIALAKSSPGIAISPTALDSDSWVLNVANGTLDLRTGELRSHAAADLISHLAPVAYDPAAESRLWKRFLERVVPDPAVQVFLQRAIGYALTGSVREHCLFFLYGTGRNGKTTFLNAIRHIMGDYSIEAEPDLLIAKKYDPNTMRGVADLHGARFVTTSEPNKRAHFNEGLIKRLTGGDLRRAERKYEHSFEYAPTDKIFVAANEKPVIVGTDEGIWSRLRTIPFLETIPESERDHELPDKLQAESAGILAWAVQGCLDWQVDGFPDCRAVTEFGNEYRSEMDLIGGFLAETCLMGGSHEVLVGVLYAAYKVWCEQTGQHFQSMRAFNAELRKRGYDTGSRTDRGFRWTGIGLFDGAKYDNPNQGDGEVRRDGWLPFDDPFAEIAES